MRLQPIAPGVKKCRESRTKQNQGIRHLPLMSTSQWAPGLRLLEQSQKQWWVRAHTLVSPHPSLCANEGMSLEGPFRHTVFQGHPVP